MVERAGQQLGNYRLTRLLGTGGFAEVYLGEHIYLNTPAAIKLLQTKVGTPEDLEGFLTEARTIAQLVHPHIVRVMDFGVDGDTPFLVMDYAPGGTLRLRHPKGTQLPLTTILPYVKHVAEALQYAHEEKFIHRDVKPENMLVGRRDAILLSDFGIALIAQSSRYQNTQEVIGTVAYMSPEQIQGKPRPASDQYSLGIVVYEWLSGDPPFRGSFTELCAQHIFAPPPPLRAKAPMISPAVEQVVMTALAKDPHQRFATIQAFATALEQASQVEIAPTGAASGSKPASQVIPQSPPMEPATDLATAPSESVIPTELITPAGQSSTQTGRSVPAGQASLPTEQSVPASQAVAPTEGIPQASRATYLPTQLATPASSTPLPGKVAPPATPSVLRPDTLIPRPPSRRGLSPGRIALFIGLALLVIGGSSGLLYFSLTQQTTSSAQITSTPPQNATETADAQIETSIAQDETATVAAPIAQAQNFLTQSTSGTPALNDPMHDNSQGVNWDQGSTCYFGADQVYHVVEPYAGDMPCFAENTDFDNFALQVQLTLNTNVVAGSEVGFIYFRSDASHTAYYNLWVEAGGCVIQDSEGQPHLLNNPLQCSGISLHTLNTATIIAKGNQISIYWNNQPAGTITNNYLSHGQIGFGSAGYGLNMVVSSVKVWRL